MNNIILVGMMGSGKSSVGKILAQKLQYVLVDIDALIEGQENSSVTKIFQEKGEPYFRDIEYAILENVLQDSHQVIAAGGGAFASERNNELLKNKGTVIYLKTSPGVLYNRLKTALAVRPLLQCNDPFQKLTEILTSREPSYHKAHHCVETDNISIEEVADNITEILHANRAC